ncbi:MAG TPA: GNAT family N-acetyltransferase [Chloroflexota bacterium]
MSVDIRPLTEADLPALLDLIQALADYEKLPGPDAEARARISRDAVADPPRFRTLLAEHDGRVIGYGLYFFTYSTFLAKPTLWVEDIFVLPWERGNGAGKAIMAALAREAVLQGCGRMEWNVLTWNAPAIALYEGIGGKILEEWRVVRMLPEAFARLAER